MMGAAQRLYESLGFYDIPPYYDTPIEGTRFMAVRLQDPAPRT
jgi:ribosomal protein S18 acetylase RimI-like enzyme